MAIKLKFFILNIICFLSTLHSKNVTYFDDQRIIYLKGKLHGLEKTNDELLNNTLEIQKKTLELKPRFNTNLTFVKLYKKIFIFSVFCKIFSYTKVNNYYLNKLNYLNNKVYTNFLFVGLILCFIENVIQGGEHIDIN